MIYFSVTGAAELNRRSKPAEKTRALRFVEAHDGITSIEKVASKGAGFTATFSGRLKINHVELVWVNLNFA